MAHVHLPQIAGSIFIVWLVWLSAAAAQAGTTRDWTNSAGNNNWFTTANWTPAGAPAADDSLIIGAYAQRTPTANSIVTSDGGGIRVYNSGSLATFNRELRIGDNSVGGLLIEQGGAVSVGSSGFTVAGRNSGGSGNLTVQGPGTTWDSLSNITLGDRGFGRLLLQNQATITSTSIRIGYLSSGSGEVEMRGTGTSWTSSGLLYVGRQGTGEVEIWEGAQLESRGGSIGEVFGGNGVVRLGHAGTKWLSRIGDIYIGGDSNSPGGTGVLDVGVSNTSSTVEVRYANGSRGEIHVWNGTGTLQGGGSVIANVVNRGGVSPGNTTGTLSIDGNYDQMSTGELNIEIGGTLSGEYDVLQASGSGSGNVTLDGVLNLLPLPSYVEPTNPGDYDLFQILTANSVTGSFSQILYGGTALSPLGGGIYGWNDGQGFFRTLVIGSGGIQFGNYDALAGDANGDGTVDDGDFNIWNVNKFQAGTDWNTADFNLDGVTDGSDFNIWNANKSTTAVNFTGYVPEPSGWLIVLAAAVLARRWRR